MEITGGRSVGKDKRGKACDGTQSNRKIAEKTDEVGTVGG